MDGHVCVLPFDTNDHEFARGVEVGRMWESLQRDEGGSAHLIHCNNAEMALRIAEATGRSVQAEELDGHWMEVTFGPAYGRSCAEGNESGG